MGSWFQLEFGCADADDAWARVALRRVEPPCRETVGVNDRVAFWLAVASLRTVVTRLKLAACWAHAGIAVTIVIANDNNPMVLLMTESLPHSPSCVLGDSGNPIMASLVLPAVSARSGDHVIQAARTPAVEPLARSRCNMYKSSK